MNGLGLQDVLSKVGEDDLTRAAKKAEQERAAWKALRAQQPNPGLTASELVDRLVAEDEGDEAGQKEIVPVHKQEKKDEPAKTPRAGFFPPPPGK